MSREKWLAEFGGTAMLLMIVVGSGIMGEQLAHGNVAIALLANSLATGAGLYVLITLLGPISGAHFNPLVSLMMYWRGERSTAQLFAYVTAQIAGAILGVWLVHLMFDLPMLQVGIKPRAGAGQWLSEIIATSGLLATILLGLRARADAIPALIGSYIMAAYWFTASTSFANPAVTIARALTTTFAGIRPADAPGFIAAQCGATVLVLLVARGLQRADIAAQS